MNLVYRPRNMNLAVSRSNGVIKAGELAALDEANSIIGSAQEKAAEIVEAAHDKYRREKERGYLEGRELADKEAFARLLDEQAHLERQLQKLEAELADVVKASIRSIFAGFDDIELSRKTVLSALQKLRQDNRIQIHLPPGLIGRFEPVACKLQAEFPEFQSIQLIDDPALSPPSFVVESNTGRVEFYLGDKLEELEALIDETVAALAREDCEGGIHEATG